jgi:hypothetical protein
MMEPRETTGRDWAVGQDDTGRAVLEWKAAARSAVDRELDSGERTFDFLKRLEIPGLELEEDARRGSYTRGCNPYDHMPRLHTRQRRA